MILSGSAERSSERPRDLLDVMGTLTIFNPLWVKHTYSVLPNIWSVCLDICVTMLTQNPTCLRRSLLWLNAFFVLAASAKLVISAPSINAATLIAGSDSRICLQIRLSSGSPGVEKFSISEFRPTFWDGKARLSLAPSHIVLVVPASDAKSYASEC